MDTQNKQIIRWAIETADLTLYYSIDSEFDPPENWDGSCPGDNGGEIHLIAQSETECLYGETTDDIAGASYLVGDCVIVADDSARAAVEDLLNRLFGSQSNWPDNYAQTRGWKLP